MIFMTKQIFMEYNDFWSKVGEKRSNSEAMNDIKMMGFNAILYDSLKDEYLCKVRLKKEFHENYKTRKNLVMMENTHLIHWAEWLDIAVIIKKYPKLIDKMMLVNRVNIVLNEPCFINQPMDFKINFLVDKTKKNKSEFTMLNTINQWVIIEVDFVIMEEQIDILEHYSQKHLEK